MAVRRHDDPTLPRRLAAACAIADEAGAILLRHLGRLRGYDEKSEVNLVSAADRESEAHIAARLCAEFPGERLVLEERDGVEGARARRAEVEAAEHAWVIDPLDGTTSFVH